MANEPVAMVTDADIRSLAAKLTGLHARLTATEQLLLGEVLRRATGHDEEGADTTGLSWAVSFNPFPCLDAVARDLASRAQESHP